MEECGEVYSFEIDEERILSISSDTARMWIPPDDAELLRIFLNRNYEEEMDLPGEEDEEYSGELEYM